MQTHAYFRKAFGLGFDFYEGPSLNLYIGPLTIEFIASPTDADGGEAPRGGVHIDPMSGECQHSWTNWGTPETMEMPTFSMFGDDSPKASVDATVQTRHCLKCNLHQRVRVS